jgi:hypothetical protein
MSNNQIKSKTTQDIFGEPVAGGGLLNRRVFLAGGALLASASAARDARADLASLRQRLAHQIYPGLF